ncbi:unnamed protein product, partial [Gongylonema pulchrum]|uniref:Phosphohydrolase n=1 Tax=Gongylonema pulchrum TaxID=637853 RepID=A0A183E0X0_9BILA
MDFDDFAMELGDIAVDFGGQLEADFPEEQHRHESTSSEHALRALNELVRRSPKRLLDAKDVEEPV